ARVDHHTGRGRRLALDEVQDRALGVRLEAGDLAAELVRPPPDHGLDVGQRGAAVDLRLAGAEQVEVGPVDDQQPLVHGSSPRTTAATTSGGTWTPTWARPISRGSTHRTAPARDFLSRGTAASTASAVVAGSSPGSAKAPRSASCRAMRS